MTTKDSEFFPRPLILLFTTYVLSSDYMPKMVLGPGGTDFYLNKTKKKKKKIPALEELKFWLGHGEAISKQY